MEIEENILTSEFTKLTLEEQYTKYQALKTFYQDFEQEEIHFLCSEKLKSDLFSQDHTLLMNNSIIGLKGQDINSFPKLDALSKRSELTGVMLTASLFRGELMKRSPYADIRLDNPIADIVHDDNLALKRMFFGGFYRSQSQYNSPFHATLILADNNQSKCLKCEGFEEIPFDDNPFLTYKEEEDGTGKKVRKFYCVKNYYRRVKTYVFVLNIGDVYFKRDITAAPMEKFSLF